MNQYERMYDILINGINEDSAEAQDARAASHKLASDQASAKATTSASKKPKKPPGVIKAAWEKAKRVLSKMARISASAPKSPSADLDDDKL